MESIFNGIFDNGLTQVIGVGDFLLCMSVSLLLGFLTAAVCRWRDEHTGSFLITVALLPAVVCVVIMMVNGNIGAGVAVAGAFSLVRFRSVPGSAREIVTIFLAMGTGLIAGMGYLGFAALFTLVMCAVLLLCDLLERISERRRAANRTLRITVPEDLDYTGAFDGIFEEYTQANELTEVKTTNMGSMFRLTYRITLKDALREKEMIDRIRERNGNLEVMVSKQDTRSAGL